MPGSRTKFTYFNSHLINDENSRSEKIQTRTHEITVFNLVHGCGEGGGGMKMINFSIKFDIY